VKNKLIVWAVLPAAGFLAGFVPQFAKCSRMETELRRTRQELVACGERLRLSAHRDLAAQVYLEGARRNYGLAAEAASRFFQGLRQHAGETPDADLKRRLEEVLRLRDTVTAGLARAEPAVMASLEQLLAETREKLRP
jgi:hypothetical protein